MKLQEHTFKCSNRECERHGKVEQSTVTIDDIHESGWPICGYCGEDCDRVEEETSDMKRITIKDNKGEGAISVWLRPVGDVISGEEGSPSPNDSVLKGTMTIAGAGFHVTALEVEKIDGEQRVKHERTEAELDGLFTFATPDGPFETATIDGREYVIYIVPFAD